MPDYLRDVGRTGRIGAIIALAVATLMFVPVFIACAARLIVEWPADPNKFRPMVGAVVVSGLLAAASLWMLVRLARGAHARNGVTMMPLWFIQVAGVVFGIGLLGFAVAKKSVPMMIESASILFIMIFVRRLVRRKLAVVVDDEAVEEEEPGADS